MDSLKGIIRGMMKEDIFKQGKMIYNNLEHIEGQIKSGLNDMNLDEIQNIYIVGCGDSWYAGLAAKLFFEKYSGKFCEAIEAHEFNTYRSNKLREKSLLVAISISGQVGTTLDCVKIAKNKGISTIGINATPGSRIHNIADRVIDIGVRVREPGPVPQTYHYLGNLTALFLLALEIGIKSRLIDLETYDDVKSDMIFNLVNNRKNCENIFDAIFNRVKENLLNKEYVIVGSGPNWATAYFGVAKLVEAACHGSILQETEEWAHEQYFITNNNTLSILIAANGDGIERSNKIYDSMQKIEGDILVITDSLNNMTEDKNVVSVISSKNEFLSPMTLKLPLEIFAYSVSELLDIRPFNYDNKVRKSVVENTIYDGGVSAEEVSRRKNKIQVG